MCHARLVLVGLTGISVACAAACHDSTSPRIASTQPAPATLTQLPRALTPAEAAVRDAANAFSFALWGKVNAAQPDTNVFLSPLSASFSLGMALNGAAGVTYDQMHGALQFGTSSLGDINASYKSLIALLQSLDPTVKMQVANSIWYRAGFPVLPSFIDSTTANFGATVQGLNFSDQQSSLATINGWASNATNGKIPTVLDEIDGQAEMFLMNAIYFKGSWRSQFDPAQTATATFTPAVGAPQSMQLMHQLSALNYAVTPAFQAVDLSYGDSAFAMTVLLPTAGTSVETLAASLTPASWQTIVASLRPLEQVDLSFPKITLGYKRRLNPDLQALGMIEPFDSNGADFTRMASAPAASSLYISFVQQDSYVDINEEGTEAAAVTVTGIFTTAEQIPPVVRVDHPYIVVIRERLTGTVLFMGKVVRMP
jgi:serine protease inhibitor